MKILIGIFFLVNTVSYAQDVTAQKQALIDLLMQNNCYSQKPKKGADCTGWRDQLDQLNTTGATSSTIIAQQDVSPLPIDQVPAKACSRQQGELETFCGGIQRIAIGPKGFGKSCTDKDQTNCWALRDLPETREAASTVYRTPEGIDIHESCYKLGSETRVSMESYLDGVRKAKAKIGSCLNRLNPSVAQSLLQKISNERPVIVCEPPPEGEKWKECAVTSDRIITMKDSKACGGTDVTTFHELLHFSKRLDNMRKNSHETPLCQFKDAIFACVEMCMSDQPQIVNQYNCGVCVSKENFQRECSKFKPFDPKTYPQCQAL